MDDNPITINDFASLNKKGKIPKKVTTDLTREDLEQIIKLNTQYSKWLKENGFYDDIDLAFAAWRNIRESPPSKYLEIYLDEAQDLTQIEFKVLKALLSKDSPLHSKGIRIALAGDPQQTINPTGFNWKHIKALFYQGKGLKQTDLEINQRTPQPIVNLANEIQKRRSYYGKEKLIEQRARELSGRPPSCFEIGGHLDEEALIQLLRMPRPGTALVIWEEDDKEIIEFIAKDPHLKKVAIQLFGEDEFSALVNGQPLELSLDKVLASLRLHTITDIKGLEFERVIFYKIASRPRFIKFLEETVKEKKIKEDIKIRIPILFHLNKLYIAVTRSTRYLFIFDQKIAVDKIWDKLQSIDMSSRNNLREINADPALAADEDRDWINDAEKYLELFKEERDRRMLAYAFDCLLRAPNNRKAQSILNEVKAELSEQDAADYSRNGDFEKANKLWIQAGDLWSQFPIYRLRATQCYMKGEAWGEVRRTLETFSHRKIENDGLLLYSILRCSSDMELETSAKTFLDFLINNPNVIKNEEWWDYLSTKLQELRLLPELIKLHMDVCWSGDRRDLKYPNLLFKWLNKQNEYSSIIGIIEEKGLSRMHSKFLNKSHVALAEQAEKSSNWESAGKHWKALINSGLGNDEIENYYRKAANAFTESAIYGKYRNWDDAANYYSIVDGPDSPTTLIANAEVAANKNLYREAFKRLSSAMTNLKKTTGPLKKYYNINYCNKQLGNWANQIDYLELSRDLKALSLVVEYYLKINDNKSAKKILNKIIKNVPKHKINLEVYIHLAGIELEDGNIKEALSYYEYAENYKLSWKLALVHKNELDQKTLHRIEGRYIANQYKKNIVTSIPKVERAISLLTKSGELNDAEELKTLRIEREKDLIKKVQLTLSDNPSFNTFKAAVKVVNERQQDQNLNRSRTILLQHLAKNNQYLDIDNSIGYLRFELASWMRDSTFIIPIKSIFSEQEWGFLIECGQDDLSAKAYYLERSEENDWAKIGFRRVIQRMIKDFKFKARTDYKKKEFVEGLKNELTEIENNWAEGTPISNKRSPGDIALMREKLDNETVGQLRERWKKAGIPKYSSLKKDVLIDLYLHFWSNGKKENNNSSE